MNQLIIDAKSGRYPYYLIEDQFLDLLIQIEEKAHFKDPEQVSEICFDELNQISENILRKLGSGQRDFILGVMGKFKIKNFKLNGKLVNSENLFWSTYAYLNFRFDPSCGGKQSLESRLLEHLNSEVTYDLLAPYRKHKF